MKTITFSHYTIKDISPEPWRKTWDNLAHFAWTMSEKLAPLGYQIKLREAQLEEITEDNLMTGNMVTVACPEDNMAETPVEDLIMLDLYFSPCLDCKTPEGREFPCRTFTNFGGEVCQALPEEFFVEAVLRVAFGGSSHSCGGSCGDCSCCG